MRLLIVDNGGARVDGGTTYTELQNREFLREIAGALPGTRFSAGSINSIGTASERLECALDMPGLVPVVLPFRGTSHLIKGISRLKCMPTVLDMTRKTDFVYAFYPGVLSKMFLAAAHFCGKKYGVYLRGSDGISSRHTKRVLSNAEFIIGTGAKIVRTAGEYCDAVEAVVPMSHLLRPLDRRPRQLRTQGPWKLLYVGRISENKGIHDLLEALQCLLHRGIGCELTLVGANNLHGEIEKTLAQLGTRVRFAGFVTNRDKLESLYRDADLFCFPSHSEGFPRVLYEAMVFQVPIVTTFVGGIAGTMTDGQNCLRAEVRDSQILATQIERALLDRLLRARLVKNGLATVTPVVEHAAKESHATQVLRKLARYRSLQRAA